MRCEGGCIAEVLPAAGRPVDHEAEWIAPALFDLQINGCMGLGFSSSELTVEHIHSITEHCHRHGISAYCPTLVTNTFEALHHGFSTLAKAKEEDETLARAIPCFHLEGPYISAEDGPRGAHAKDCVRPPDWNEFLSLQDAAGGDIRLVTLSPEYPNSVEFIERAGVEGIVIAIGHTAATPEQIHAAVQAGATLSTHLGNGAHGTLPRHPNYIWEQLAEDLLHASIITDGFHLPDSVVKCILRTKTAERLVLTCDASSLAGLPAGKYEAWGLEFEVKAEGRVVVPGTPYLAGSAVFLDDCISKLLSLGELSLIAALDMAGKNPRRLLRQESVMPELGNRAELILFDGGVKNFDLRATVVGGTVWEAIP